ncbi:hypothetical protein [Parapedobacter composti]|nr:hypothetical protein [Parapedobacter composti]
MNNIITACVILGMMVACMPERESFPLPEDTPQEPVGEQLFEVLKNPASGYNAIAIDPLNPDLPQDFKERWDQAVQNVHEWVYSGSSGRMLHSMYIRFGQRDTVDVVALYHLRASSNKVLARWTYTMALDDNGVGRLEFVRQNGNGNILGPIISPLLAYFLEEHDFRVRWVDETISVHPTEGTRLGGFFRTDNPSSFVFGTLTNVPAIDNDNWPLPSTPSLDKFFKIENPVDAPYYTSVLINPDDPAQSQGFRDLWTAVKTDLQNSSGRQLHQMLFVFDPEFARLRILVYYYTATGSRTSAFYRYVPALHYDDRIRLLFNSEDGNAALIRDSRLMDNFLEAHDFVISETQSAPSGGGKYLTFTSTTTPSISFFGELGNRAANCCAFWPE